MVYSILDIFLLGKVIGLEANGLSLITWQNATLPPASLAYFMTKTIFYSVIDYEQEEPKRIVGKATKREKYLLSHKSDHVPCPPNYTHSKLLFAWRTKFKSCISNRKAFWELALPFSCSQSLPPTYTNSAFQSYRQNYVHLLNMAYCSTSSCLPTCHFRHWSRQPFP